MIFKTFKAGDVLKAQELNDLQEHIGQQIVDKSLDSDFIYGGPDLFERVRWEKRLDGTFSAILRSTDLQIDPQSTAGMPETAELQITTGEVYFPFDITSITDVAWAFPDEAALTQHVNVKVGISNPSMILDIQIFGDKALFDNKTSTSSHWFDIYLNGRWK